MRKAWIIGLLGFWIGCLHSPFASAEDQTGWACRNIDYEIGCNEDGCRASDAHTPMAIYLTDGSMEVCAYTGCWSGVPTYQQQGGRFEMWTGHSLPFSTQPDGAADISITVDTQAKVATVLVGDLFATPATCRVHPELVD